LKIYVDADACPVVKIVEQGLPILIGATRYQIVFEEE
jgi:uncharacterized protein YaiI (UPF0178 family)